MKRPFRSQRGSFAVNFLILAFIVVVLAIMPPMLDAFQSASLPNALNVLGAHGYTAYSSPSDEFTVPGNLVAKTGRSSSIVVANSDSSTLEKNQADYVVVGAATDEITAALTACPSGGVVQLLSTQIGYSVTNLSVIGKTLKGFSSSNYGAYTAGTRLNVSGSITCSAGGRLWDVYVKAPNNFAGYAVTVTGGTNQAYWNVNDILKNITVECSTQTGTGFYFNCLASTDDSSIALSTLGRLQAIGFEYSGRVVAADNGGFQGYFNHNRIEYFGYSGSINGFYTSRSAGGEITGNTVGHLDLSGPIANGLTIDGNFNVIQTYIATDNVAGADDVEIANSGDYNQILSGVFVRDIIVGAGCTGNHICGYAVIANLTDNGGQTWIEPLTSYYTYRHYIPAVTNTFDWGTAELRIRKIWANNLDVGSEISLAYMNFYDSALVVMAGGVITIYQNYHKVDTSGGASEDLNTINGGTAGMVLIIKAYNDARTVVAKDGVGNLQLSADMTLDNTQDTLTLIFDGANWLEIARSNNGA
jgi:hypothetical protein